MFSDFFNQELFG